MASSECIAESTSKRRRQDSESDETNVPKLSRSGSESSTTDSETIDITSSSQSQTESSSGDNRQVSRWSEFGFDTLRIQVIRRIFDPPEVFNSFNDFFENDDKKRELICSWFEKHDEKRVTKYADVYRAFEKIVLLDCDNIEKTDIRMNNDLVWLYRSLARDQGDSLGLVKVRLVDFLAQLIYMVSEVKTNGSASLKEGMYQELFVRFTKIFGLEIVCVPNISPCAIKVGNKIVKSTPDCLVIDGGLVKKNVLAVVEVKKRYSQEDDIKETRTSRGSEKMSTPVKHIDHQLKGQHVGEMLSKLKDSVIGPTGIYGFIIQGTEVTIVALSAEDKYLEYLEKGSFPKKDGKGVTLKYSKRCNYLEKNGRLALVKTFCDLAELSLFAET